MGYGSGKGGGNILMGILWFLALWFISFAVALFCAAWYIPLYCLEACSCCKCLKAVTEILLKGIQFPNMCCKNFLQGFGCG